MAAGISTRSNLFSFMVIRDPSAIAEKTLRTAYIQDDTTSYYGRKPVDIFSHNSDSIIGHLVYEKIFCPPSDPGSTEELPIPSLKMRNLEIVEAAVELLTPNYAPCQDKTPPVGMQAISIELLVGRHYFERNDLIYCKSMDGEARPCFCYLPVSPNSH
jgi:hypothetical protein